MKLVWFGGVVVMVTNLQQELGLEFMTIVTFRLTAMTGISYRQVYAVFNLAAFFRA